LKQVTKILIDGADVIVGGLEEEAAEFVGVRGREGTSQVLVKLCTAASDDGHRGEYNERCFDIYIAFHISCVLLLLE
jgi:hypothetical protein